ncbi:MAG: Xaa-Pro aminopeptidase [Thiotrichales bacterium]|nr:Xaa-Pro aminopeptidase [Thiotrichales bacterium]
MHRREFAKRRRRLMDMMGEGSIAIVPTAPVRTRNRDVDFPYRPDSNFYYLTGFGEPEAVAVLAPGREQGEFVMFCRERDPAAEQWHGTRLGLEGACGRHGADDAFPIGDIDDILPGLLENRTRVFYPMGHFQEFDQRMLAWVARVRGGARSSGGLGEFVMLDHLVHEMRLFKSKAEIGVMSKAAEVSAAAHERAMRICRPGMSEYEIEAELLYEFTRAGCRAAAYPSIVAGGSNACTLHYVENSDRLRDRDLLLIDAGAEHDCYASDITRTFPVNGRFSGAQRDVYSVVLAAQEAAIDTVAPGRTFDDVHMAAVQVLVEGLVDLGAIKGRVKRIIEKEKYKRFYMHRTGHWLGMDVHDVGDYRIDDQSRMLEPGMVMTVEPGLYIRPDDEKAPKRLRGIGIRIEDDVLVTKAGRDVLTSAVPKSIDDIEAIVGSG